MRVAQRVDQHSKTATAMFYYKCGKNKSNFGDLVGPYLYERIAGKAPKRINEGNCRQFTREPLLVTCGSLIQNWNMRSNWIIWGSGIYRRTEKLRQRPSTVLAVRGPLSRNVLLKSGIQCPKVYGDPALLLPRFYKAKRDAHTHRVGLLPHYTGYEKVKKMFAGRPGIYVIDVDRPVEQVCDDIASCEVTFAGSLHGVIVSHAYNVSCVWVKREGFEKKEHRGDGVKYEDYFLSVGLEVGKNGLNKVELSSILDTPTPDLVTQAKDYPQVTKMPNLDLLMEACPFPKRK